MNLSDWALVEQQPNPTTFSAPQKNNRPQICATQKLRIYLQPKSCAFKCTPMKQDIFQAIADPTRRAILTLIAIQALTPNALAEEFDMTRQAVSKHIKVLHECELIKPEQSGREIYYHLNPQKMQEIDHWFCLLYTSRCV